MARSWVKATKGNVSRIVEDNNDRTYTTWSYSPFGAIGSRGTPKAGVQISKPTKADVGEIERLEKMLKSAKDRSRAAYFNLGGRGRV